MAQVIGIIKLAPGEVGFYDEISKIHLTMSRPKAEVYDYMNTTKLIRAVRSKVLILVAGSLNAARTLNEEAPVAKLKEVSAQVVKEEKVVKETIPQVAMFAEEIIVPEEVQPLVEETATEEEVVEEVQEEVVEIEQPKKRTTTKKKK